MANPSERATAKRNARERMAHMKAARRESDERMASVVEDVLVSAATVDGARAKPSEVERDLESAIQEHTDAQERAVQLLRDEGATLETIADLLGVSHADAKRLQRSARPVPPSLAPAKRAPLSPPNPTNEGETHE